MRKILIIAMTGFLLVGCANNKASQVAGQLITGTLPNPLTSTNIYELKNVYAIAAQSAVSYRGYCYSVSYAAVLADPIKKPICQNRRATVRNIQRYKKTAFAAVVAADNFVKNNPTLGVGSVVNDAWSAVTAFQNVIPAVPK